MLASHVLRPLLTEGRLTVIDAGGKRHVFDGCPGPAVTVRLHDRSLHHRLLLNPKLAIGEAYMDGTLTIEDAGLYDLVDLLALNLAAYENRPSRRFANEIQRVLRVIHTHNPMHRAQRNVAHHYDLSGALYDLFLDRDRQYSCAYFTPDTETLEEAQENKKLHLAAKLLLKSGQRLLDIGSGWGGLALYLSRLTGVDATGITLSTEQHKVSNQRAEADGLGERVRFHLRDYRAETGRYDRIVSVGMFEHVGVPHYETFFRKVSDLLADDGVALLHSIGRMEPPGGTNPWLRKYIFPGGYTPALSEVLTAIERVGLWVTDIEILRLHYAETLRHWRRRFDENRERVRAIYDDRFCRMWEFYLVGCEIAFRRLNQMVFQIQIARRQEAVPLTRDYIYEFERAHREREPTAAAAE
ncbi:MAG TPA: cyclopropane-fatty-acyl-phospholipid synthase family protein [Alphaproteobacteria bacterium]|nr:cyclopropane-fatty-acyl-phospholipid synthase family protein [Alphaproteobacteria bacterium]